MPEGDTIHKLARFLQPRLTGERLQHAKLRHVHDAGLAGKRIDGVYARGKHLFIELDDGQLLRSHLGMYGSWHEYAPGESWRRPRRQASIEIATSDAVFVCFNAKEVEVMQAGDVRSRTLATRLGPDLLGATVDVDAIVARVRDFLSPDTLLADVLLDQRVASGIGNVYKSEVLFIGRRDPRTPASAVEDTELAGLYVTARNLLSAHLGGGPRRTRAENDAAGRLWVYRRTGQPCLQCDAVILSARLGITWRSTYWCPTCQQGSGARFGHQRQDGSLRSSKP